VTAPKSRPPAVAGAAASSDDRHFSGLDTSRAHPARRYNYWLGGKDNFAADRESGDRIADVFPTIRIAAVENRRFMQRAVAFLAREMGIRQFLDIGSGIPMRGDVHEIAQAIAAESRVVYVDSDPLVMTHARALTVSTPAGAIAYIEADLRDPDKILDDPGLRDTLNLRQPIALLLIAVLHFLTDQDDPYPLVARLINALPSGSVVVVSHGEETLNAAVDRAGRNAGHGAFQPRTSDEVARFLAGLELLAPGLVSIVDWRPDDDPNPAASAADTTAYGAVARLP
jgi:S-adenosyl methyltransferase